MALAAIDALDIGRQGSKTLASRISAEGQRRLSFREGVHYKVNHHEAPNPEDWADHLSDLRSVLDVVKQLFLVLQHSNEALIRVALEIVLDGQAADLLSWSYESIFEEEDNHRWLQTLVSKKLELALKFHPGTVGSEYSCKKTVTSDAEVQTAVEENLEAKQQRAEIERLQREAEETRQRTSNALEQINAERRRLQKDVQRKEEKLDSAEARAKIAEEKLKELQQESASPKRAVESNAAANDPPEPLASPSRSMAKVSSTKSLSASDMAAEPSASTNGFQAQTDLPSPQRQRRQLIPLEPNQQEGEVLVVNGRGPSKGDDGKAQLAAANQRIRELEAELAKAQEQQRQHQQLQKRAATVAQNDEGTQTSGLEPEDDGSAKLDAANQRISELGTELAKAMSAVAGVKQAEELRSGQNQEVKPHLGVMLAGLAHRVEAVRDHCRREGVSEAVAEAANNKSFLKALTVWERLFQDSRSRELKQEQLKHAKKQEGAEQVAHAVDGGSRSLQARAGEELDGSDAWRTRAVHKAAEKLCRALRRNRSKQRALENQLAGPEALQLEERPRPPVSSAESHRSAAVPHHRRASPGPEPHHRASPGPEPHHRASPGPEPHHRASPGPEHGRHSASSGTTSVPPQSFVSHTPPPRRSSVGDNPSMRSTSGLLATLPAMHGSVPLGHRHGVQPRQRQRSTPNEDASMAPILSAKSLQGFHSEGSHYMELPAAQPHATRDMRVLESMHIRHEASMTSQGFQTIRKAGHRARSMMSTVGAQGLKGSNARYTGHP